MPLRSDIDGDLVWVTQEGDPALILEEDYADCTRFWVRLRSPDGDMVTQVRYDSLRDALKAFMQGLPEDA